MCFFSTSNTFLKICFQSLDEWEVNDVSMWLAATRNYQYAEVFRENEITGPELRQLTDTKLNQMNITDAFHKQSLLLAIQELFHGDSETVNTDQSSSWYKIIHRVQYSVELQLGMANQHDCITNNSSTNNNFT